MTSQNRSGEFDGGKGSSTHEIMTFSAPVFCRPDSHLPESFRWKRNAVSQAKGSAQALPFVRAHPMCNPPLMEKSAPVANPDSSDATHDTIDAMSAGVPRRFTGMPAMILSSTSWRIALTMSVAM